MSRGSSTHLLRLPASLKAAVAEISKEVSDHMPTARFPGSKPQ